MMAEDFSKKLREAKSDVTVMKMDRDHFSIIISMAAKSDDPLTKAMVEMMTKK